MADLCRARYSRVQPGVFSKSRRFKDVKYDTERSLVDHLDTTSRPLLLTLKISAVLHAFLMPFFDIGDLFSSEKQHSCQEPFEKWAMGTSRLGP